MILYARYQLKKAVQQQRPGIKVKHTISVLLAARRHLKKSRKNILKALLKTSTAMVNAMTVAL